LAIERSLLRPRPSAPARSSHDMRIFSFVFILTFWGTKTGKSNQPFRSTNARRTQQVAHSNVHHSHALPVACFTGPSLD
jgi:hypothetical protein